MSKGWKRKGVTSGCVAAAAAGVLASLLLAVPGAARAEQTLLNVSYDPTRELYKDVNAQFSAQWQAKTGEAIEIKQSHGGSGTQARSVIDGLDADVLTLALYPDLDAVRKVGLVNDDWQSRYPHNAVPFTSTVVFAVRQGNPKHIKDWPDLVQPGVEIITPNPKTSGNGKLSFLAAWGSVTQRGGSEEQAKAFVEKLYQQAPVLDSGARGSTITFAEKQIGDVQLTWENEAHLMAQEHPGEIEIVYPPISFLAEPPVAVVDVNARRKGTTDAATAYLGFLFTPEGQEIGAKHFYRPFDESVMQRHAATFPNLTLFPITAVAKDWTDANAKFFNDGKIFDSIYGRK